MGYEPTNEDRAARIDAVRDAYWRARADIEDCAEEFVTDLLADLMHFCMDREIDFDARLEMARMHYEEEV